MAINKVAYGDQTLLDLTEDTVTADKVLEGETFHDKSGVLRSGNLVIPVQDVEVNGESVVNAEGIAEVVVPVSGDVSTIDSFESYTGGKVKSLQMELSPIQDLHGYPEPWVGGSRKNKLPLPTAETKNGITLTRNADGSVTLTGTSTNIAYFDFFAGNFDTETYAGYIFRANSANSSWGPDTIEFRISTSSRVSLQSFFGNNNYAINNNGSGLYFAIRISANYSIPSGGVTIYPMLRNSTETAYFEPYSNICPISAHTQAKLEQRGKNLSASQINNTDLCHVEGSKTYTLSYKGAYLFNLDIKYDGDTSYSRIVGGADVPYTFTPSRSGIINLNCFNNNISDIQVELGSSATDYEPYQGKDYIINLGGTYYWLRGDVVSGKWYVVGQSIEYDGSSDEEWYKISGENRYYTPKPTDVSNHLEGTISNNFKFYGNQAAGVPDGQFYIGASNLGVRLDSITAVADWKTFLSNNPMMIIYPLATPIPIDLDPQLIEAFLGENNFSAPLEQQEIIEIIARNIAEFNEVIDDENISDEFTYSSEKIEDRLDEYVDKDAVEEKSATDEFSTYNGGLLSECKVALSPNQDLHGYDHPWVGGAGKNLINKDGVDTDNGYKHKYYITQFGTESPANGNWDILEYVKVEPSTTYTISGHTPLPSNGFAEYDENKQLVNAFALASAPFTFTTTANTHYIRANRQYTTDDNIQFEKGSTATAYEPYENICPISGHTQAKIGDDGKNRFNPSTCVLNKYIDDDGTIGNANGFMYSQPICVKDGSYKFSGSYSGSGSYSVRILGYDKDDNFVSLLGRQGGSASQRVINVDATVTSGIKFVRLSLPQAIDKPQLELGSTATPYEPYNGYQLTVNLGNTYYSGTLDVVSGVFVPNTAGVEYDGSNDENWGLSAFYSNTVIILRPADCAGNDDAISEQYKGLSNASDLSTEEGFFIGSNINIRDDKNAIDVATWKAYLANNPVKVVYPLANPTPIQLSMRLKRLLRR